MTRLSCIIILNLLFVLFSNTTVYGLRCGSELVSIGDRKSEVLRKCGEPAYIEVKDEVRIKRDFHGSTLNKPEYEQYRLPFLVEEYVKIEEWEYNFGPSRLIYYLRFENDRLKKINTGKYGY